LGFAWCDVVWASPPIFAVIVDIQIVSRCGYGSDILYGSNNEELVARRHLLDRLTGSGVLFQPNVINRQIRQGSRMDFADRPHETRKTDHQNEQE
jgi:hypothetical protein